MNLDFPLKQDKGNVDILLIFQNTLEEKFPLSQLKTEEFNAPFRLDDNISSGDIMLHVRKYRTAKLLIMEKCQYPEN